MMDACMQWTSPSPVHSYFIHTIHPRRTHGTPAQQAAAAFAWISAGLDAKYFAK
jgi:hypothetical protein